MMDANISKELIVRLVVLLSEYLGSKNASIRKYGCDEIFIQEGNELKYLLRNLIVKYPSSLVGCGEDFYRAEKIIAEFEDLLYERTGRSEQISAG